MSLFTELHNFEARVKYCNNGILTKVIKSCDDVLDVSVFKQSNNYGKTVGLGTIVTYKNGSFKKTTVPVDEYFYLEGDHQTDIEKLSIATVEKLFGSLPYMDRKVRMIELRK